MARNAKNERIMCMSAEPRFTAISLTVPTESSSPQVLPRDANHRLKHGNKIYSYSPSTLPSPPPPLPLVHGDAVVRATLKMAAPWRLCELSSAGTQKEKHYYKMSAYAPSHTDMELWQIYILLNILTIYILWSY